MKVLFFLAAALCLVAAHEYSPVVTFLEEQIRDTKQNLALAKSKMSAIQQKQSGFYGGGGTGSSQARKLRKKAKKHKKKAYSHKYAADRKHAKSAKMLKLARKRAEQSKKSTRHSETHKILSSVSRKVGYRYKAFSGYHHRMNKYWHAQWTKQWKLYKGYRRALNAIRKTIEKTADEKSEYAAQALKHHFAAHKFMSQSYAHSLLARLHHSHVRQYQRYQKQAWEKYISNRNQRRRAHGAYRKSSSLAEKYWHSYRSAKESRRQAQHRYHEARSKAQTMWEQYRTHYQAYRDYCRQISLLKSLRAGHLNKYKSYRARARALNKVVQKENKRMGKYSIKESSYHSKWRQWSHKKHEDNSRRTGTGSNSYVFKWLSKIFFKGMKGYNYNSNKAHAAQNRRALSYQRKAFRAYSSYKRKFAIACRKLVRLMKTARRYSASAHATFANSAYARVFKTVHGLSRNDNSVWKKWWEGHKKWHSRTSKNYNSKAARQKRDARKAYYHHVMLKSAAEDHEAAADMHYKRYRQALKKARYSL